MAEGEKSTNLARKMVCDICGLEGQKRYAIYFCRQCQKNFCIDCRNNHLKTQETHSHVLVEREEKKLLLSDNSTLEDEMINLSALTLSSVPPEAPLCIEHEHECKYFCKVHMVELCLLCKGTDHKNCDEVIDFKEAVEHVYSQSDDDKVTNVLKQLMERFDRCKASADESKFKLTTKGDIERTEIRQVRQRIDRYLDSLEAKALAETDEVIDTERKALDERINSCNSSISLFAAYEINLNNVKSRGSNTEKFIVRNRVTKDIKQYSMLLDLFEDKSASGEKLVQNKKFKNLYDLSKIIEKMTTPRANSSTRNITNEPVTMPPEERNSQQLGPMVQVVPTINPVPAEGNVFAPIGIPPIGLAPVWQTLRPAQPAISSPIQVILQPSQVRQTGPTIDPAAFKEVQMRSDSMNVIPVIRSSPTKPTIVTEMPQPVLTNHNGMKDFHTRSNNRTARQSSTNKIFALDQEPLTAFMLAAVPPQEQKQMLGERLFPKIQRMQPDLAGKVTGMLLEIDNSELLQMLESHMSLRAKVEEAVAVLNAHQAKVNNQVKDITQNQQASQPHLNKTLVVQNLRDPLTASMLAAAPPQEQKQMLGERLFPFIHRMHPDLAGKITGMLLELDNSELLRMLKSSDSLKLKVEEAVAVLQAYQAKESAHQLAKAMS